MNGGQTLPVSEVFGPTWQGEGRHAGRVCGFVRLGLCNLSCEWCDTPYTWDRTRYDVKDECPDVPWYDVGVQVAGIAADMWVLSGGEPLIHALRHVTCPLGKLMTRAVEDDDNPVEWHVETNGTLIPPAWFIGAVTHATVSPKINTRDPEHRRLRPSSLMWWASAARRGWVDFKFVVEALDDLRTIDLLVDTYKIPADRVWVMPEGTSPSTVVGRHRLIAPYLAGRGYNTTTRLQTLLFDDERGH